MRANHQFEPAPNFFRGTVVIAPDNGVAVNEAIQVMRCVPTAQRIQLCIFTDASFNIRTGHGGYALAYTSLGLEPDTSNDYMQTAKGWPALGVNDNHEVEALAIAQSLREAIRELTIIEERVIARHTNTTGAGGRVEVSVRIFSDSQTVLKRIKAGKFPKEMKVTGHAIIMSEKLSERFRGPDSKVKVDLVVHFIPGHHPSFPQHQVADQLSRKCRETGQPFLRVGNLFFHYKGTDSVYEEIRASKQHRAERVIRWKEAEDNDESPAEVQELVEGETVIRSPKRIFIVSVQTTDRT